MSWLFPGFLLGALAVGLPILLHALRRRPKHTIAFPSLRFLVATLPRSQRQQRLRRWLVLVLRCAALALLAAAFARPFFGGTAATGRKATVVLIDNSFSLQAGSRWPELRQWAAAQIGAPGPQDTLGLLLLGPRPTWLAPMSTDAGAARARLENVPPGWEAARVEPGLRLAADVLAATPADQREIIFLGDHQRVSWAGANFSRKLPAGIDARFPPPRARLQRQAALRAPTVTRSGNTFHVRLPLQNFTGPQTRTLRLYRDAAPAPVHQETITLDERETRTLQWEVPAGDAGERAYFRFALDADDLPADDQAYGVWQSAGERVVMLDAAPLGRPADFLGAALGATAEIAPALHVIPVPAGAWPAGGVAVLRNDASFSGEPAARLGAFLCGGGAALVFIGGGPAQTTWLATIAGVTVRPLSQEDAPLVVRDWAMDHALVSALSAHRVNALLGWEFRRGWSFPTDAVDPLALWSGTGAAIGETAGDAGRLLLCGFTADRRDGEWPVREMFVPFVHRAVSYLLGARDRGASPPALVGEALALPAESGQWRALAGPSAGLPAAETAGVAPNVAGPKVAAGENVTAGKATGVAAPNVTAGKNVGVASNVAARENVGVAANVAAGVAPGVRANVPANVIANIIANGAVGAVAGGGAIAVRGAITPTAPGIYEFTDGATRRWFAVNLAPAESDPTPWSEGAPWLDLVAAPPLTPTPLVARLNHAAREMEQRSSSWWWLIAAMAVVTMAELGLANRTSR